MRAALTLSWCKCRTATAGRHGAAWVPARGVAQFAQIAQSHSVRVGGGGVGGGGDAGGVGWLS